MKNQNHTLIAAVSFLLLLSFIGFAKETRDTVPPESLYASGRVHFVNGDFVRCVESMTDAATEFARQGKQSAQADALIYLGEAHHSLGNQKLAVSALQSALTVAQEHQYRAKMQRAKHVLGAVFSFTRDSEEAHSYLQESLDSAVEDGHHDAAAAVSIDLGNLYQAQGEFDDAAAAYATAAKFAEMTRNNLLTAKSLMNIAATAAMSGDVREAETTVNQSLEGTARLANSHTKAQLLIIGGNTYKRLATNSGTARGGLLGKAHRAYSDAIEVAEAIEDQRSLTYALGYMGELYEQERRYPEALQWTRKAVFIAQQIQSRDALYRWQWQIARLLRALGQPDESISSYRQAIDTVQVIRQDIAVGYGNSSRNSSFREQLGALYFELADMLFQRAEKETDPHDVQQTLLAARETIERLRTAEMDDYFQDDCIELARSKVKTIDLIGTGAAIVYVVPLADRIELLITLESGLRHFRSEIGAEALDREVRSFRQHLEKRTTHRYMQPARNLYDWLIRPIKDAIDNEGVKTLVFVPDGILLTVPMAALHDGDHFLIERYAVAVIPGLTLMDPRPIKQVDMQLVGGGITETVQGFPQLLYVSQELGNLEKIFPDSTDLRDRSFVLGNIRKAIADESPSIVHVATHGEFNRDAGKSFLLTYDDKLTLNDLENLIRPGSVRGRPVELLTLSACETAAGDDRAAFGLAGAAFKAGARSVMGTLWYVNDRASADLITKFYEELQANPSITKADALRHSQLAMLDDRRFRHPRYWSPYLIIGNWL